MAIIETSNQFRYTGKGPSDVKALVKTFTELTSLETWTTKQGSFNAYNGMITAVWLNKDDTTKNGVYLLFDPEVTNTIKKPDVTNPDNWHKFANVEDVAQISNQILSIQEELTSVNSKVAALEKDKVVITRDNEYNYKQKTPVNNEVCLVDVPGKGIRVKVGDGITSFNDLPYIDDAVLNTVDNLIVKGYFHEGAFYKNSAHAELLENIQGRVYIDIVTSKTYGFNGTSYESTVVKATAATAGIVKLYDELGTNTDGAMTQRAVTDELNQKFEVDFDEESEMLIFDNDFDDNI